MKRILVCDDDHEIVQAICVYLTDAGFEIVQAYSGKEALQCVLDPDQQIDLIIMDVMMPEVNGIEATKKIRDYIIYQSLCCRQNQKMKIRSQD